MDRKDRKKLNKEFLDFYLFSSIPSTRVGLIANLLLFFLFEVGNELFLPEVKEFRYFLRFGIIIPFFLIYILTMYIRKLRPFLSILFIILNTLLCVTIFLVGVTSGTHEPGYQYYYAWVMLMTIGLYTFFRLRFAMLVTLGLLQLVAYILANILNHSFSDNLVLAVNNLFFVISTAVLGFFIAYSFQKLNKKNFLHQKALDAQYKRVLAEFNEKTIMEEELKIAAEQKVVMLKEIHHRVKNNLAIVISMLSLQMRKVHDPELKKIISDIELRIRSMALIHEHLYRSEDLDRVKLHEYLSSLTTIVLSSFSSPNVVLDKDFEPMEVSIETALPVGLITNELLTNAIKYAFTGNQEGIITARLSQKNGTISLTIADNGSGFPADFKVDDQHSLGMFIVKLLVEQLNGVLTIKSTEGTSFSIDFPFSPIRKLFNK
ncbi:MAG: ATP-binding protein [Bacteroidales bacterium]|nr:ATP-binding protein [Bacteroidales bacterium]